MNPKRGPITKRSQVGEPKVRKQSRLGESASGRLERLKWERERDEYRASHPDCEFWERVAQSGVALVDEPPVEHWGPIDVHHVQSRGMGGTRGPVGPKASLCRGHHDFLESHRLQARELGLLVRRQPWMGGRR